MSDNAVVVDDADASVPDAPSDDTQPTSAAADQGESRLPRGTLVDERYRVEELLGSGAMGAVYRAEHVLMQKAVALKVLHRETCKSPELVRRFEREAVAAGRVEHPNVVGATDFGRLADGSLYLVLEYLKGKSLGQLLREKQPLDAARSASICMQIATALGAAHAAQIIHRDLKPDNVMLVPGDQDAEVAKVLDFGMAKLTETETGETKLTLHGAVYGTPQYMAPEQAAGDQVDHRADLYALGLILFEMLAARPAFEADTMMALLVKHMTESAPALPSSVPRPLSDLVRRLLEKDPERRPDDTEAVIAQLSEFLTKEGYDPRLAALGVTARATPGTPRAPLVTMAEWKDQVVEQMTPLLDRAKHAGHPAWDYLKGSISLAGQQVPRWAPLSAVVGFVGVGLLLFLFSAAEPDSKEGELPGANNPRVTRPMEKDPAPPGAELARVIAAAERGERTALFALEQRSEDERSLTEWMGLARARLLYKRVPGALFAFGRAIELEPSMKYDQVLWVGLRKLVDEPAYAKMIVQFVAEHGGSVGADFLFDVWAKTSLKTKATRLAHQALTERSVVERYSPELEIAMKLRETEDCNKLLVILPQVQEVGDERTLNALRPLERRSGCGADESSDCYPCLRGHNALSQALAVAGTRKAPRFTGQFRFLK